MNKFYPIIVFLLIFSFLATAQTVTVSEDLSLRNDIGYEIIGELKGQLLLFRDKNTDFEIHAFDKGMHQTWEKDLELDKRYPKPLAIFSNQDNFSLFYRFREKGKTVLKVHKYDAGANLIDSTIVKDFGFLFFTPNFEFTPSEDKSKVLIYFIETQSVVGNNAIDK